MGSPVSPAGESAPESGSIKYEEVRSPTARAGYAADSLDLQGLDMTFATEIDYISVLRCYRSPKVGRRSRFSRGTSRGIRALTAYGRDRAR